MVESFFLELNLSTWVPLMAAIMGKTTPTVGANKSMCLRAGSSGIVYVTYNQTGLCKKKNL